MTINVSPLDLLLDEQNPRFLAINQRSQTAIRKYMAMYEDVCKLARDINDNEGLLLGERVVVIEENNQHIVMEGNRRICALQFMLNRELIPEGFEHKINYATTKTLANITNIDADIAPNRNYAILLMAKRHISGVKDWKPLAKKQFFATMYDAGNSINELSEKTGVNSSNIRKDIRDYKFLLKASNEYKKAHPEFEEDFMSYHINPFLRIFSAKQETSPGIREAPVDILKIKYDNKQNTKSDLPKDIFQKIIQLIFKATIVDETVGTRDTLFNVEGVKELLDTIQTDKGATKLSSNGGTDVSGYTNYGNEDLAEGKELSKSGGGTKTVGGDDRGISSTDLGANGTQHSRDSTKGLKSNGPTGGGSAPSAFFENVLWKNKLFPDNRDHKALIIALDELHRMSKNTTKYNGRSVKIYYAYPVGAGMLLRTAYEQALILQLKKTGLWEPLKAQFTFPMLSNIENQVKNNLTQALPDNSMRRAFNQIISAKSRDFLNSNVHSPWLIRATSDSLEGIANGGMLSLIQMIIDYQ